MSALNRNTCRRLKRLQQLPSVWEGDRRPLVAAVREEAAASEVNGSDECILWVDGSEGVVRAMDVVSNEVGPEAVVRALLRAMEYPQSPAKPARPSKIVIRDREIQFFLRGVLQDLDITIEYVPHLPLIDELFRGFEESAHQRKPQLPPSYAELLIDQAYEIWQEAPWDLLADHHLLSIEINRWDIGTLYVSVMGMLGMEYGVLLYRSLESLKQFRAAVVARDSFEEMEQAFLGQNCLFVTYGRATDQLPEDEDMDLADLPLSEVIPGFGSVHPLEGLRPFLDEEEALVVYVALEALNRFLRNSYRQLEATPFPHLSKRYRIQTPQAADSKTTASVKVSTLPEVSVELLEMTGLVMSEELDEDEEEFDTTEITVPLREDLVPSGAVLKLETMPWESLEAVRPRLYYYQSKDVIVAGDGMPVVLIQTTRNKARELIERIQTDGGLKAICFNPGEDPLEGERYDLGILQTENSHLYLFGEFLEADPQHSAARQRWDESCKKLQGYCGLVIARGLAGASSGNPQLRDIMALFEARAISARELGLGMLQLMPQVSLD